MADYRYCLVENHRSLVGGNIPLAVICGSGDAASVAFNGAVTPFAAQFGMSPLDLGSLAAFAGCLGRTMSSMASVTFV